MNMGLIFIRTSIIFITLLIIMRLMGKRQIGEMQPYELVITLVIAELACIPMADTSIPLLYGIVSIITIYFLHQIVCRLDLYAPKTKLLISGKPSVVINKNGIDEYQLKKNSMDVSDLLEALRTAGYFSLSAVEYALFEANGSFAALPKQNYEEEQTSLPYLVIDEGKINSDNLKKLNLSESFIKKVVQENKIKRIKNVFVMTLDGKGKLYLQEHGKPCVISQTQLPEGVSW